MARNRVAQREPQAAWLATCYRDEVEGILALILGLMDIRPNRSNQLYPQRRRKNAGPLLSDGAWNADADV